MSDIHTKESGTVPLRVHLKVKKIPYVKPVRHSPKGEWDSSTEGPFKGKKDTLRETCATFTQRIGITVTKK